jgi:hypothetical protein
VATLLKRNVPACFSIAWLLLTGCGRAPSFDVLGSYFPAWLFCVLIGIAGASILASILSKLGMQSLIRWSILVYPCLAGSIAFTLWLLFFS